MLVPGLDKTSIDHMVMFNCKQGIWPLYWFLSKGSLITVIIYMQYVGYVYLNSEFKISWNIFLIKRTYSLVFSAHLKIHFTLEIRGQYSKHIIWQYSTHIIWQYSTHIIWKYSTHIIWQKMLNILWRTIMIRYYSMGRT